jgi:hypothetical protein
MSLLDTYERKARLTPGLYAILPVAVTITTLGLERSPLISGLAGLLSAAGGSWLLSMVVGNFGRSVQRGLFENWGGPPTTKALRLREPAENSVQRDLWRGAVEHLSGVDLLDAEAEAADPVDADQRITSGTAQILHLGQEDGQSAVRHENAAYGFERNIFGFRHVARGIALICIAVQVTAALGPWSVSTSAGLIGALVSTSFLALWIFLPSEKRTRAAAERYTVQLLIAAQNHSRRLA